MTLSKETLNKTVVLIQEEIKQIKEKEVEVFTQIKQHSVGNFNVNYVEKRWYGKDEEKTYEVTFKHSNKEVALDFRIFSDGTIDRVSWSSWSFTKITKEEIQKSIDYIEAVKEMLTIMSDTSVAQETMAAVTILYIEELTPLKTKRWEVEAELKKVQQEIDSIEKDEIFTKALLLFKDTVYFNDCYQIGRRNYVKSVKIEQKKDKYFAVMDEVRKRVDIQEIVNLYEWAHKTVKSHEYSETEEDRYHKTYYKNDNMFLTREESLKPIKTEITEKEWRLDKKIKI